MYLTLIQLAESLGVEPRVVEGWIRDEGLPSVTDRGRLLFDRTEPPSLIRHVVRDAVSRYRCGLGVPPRPSDFCSQGHADS